MYLDAAGVDGNLTYFYQKPSYSFADNYYFADLRNIDSVPRWTPSIIFLSIVGLVWFGVGIFVLFKQGSQSPFVIHFATVCLAAFVFHTYRSIGTEQDLDLAIGLVDDLAFAMFVPLFLHFCIRYPVRNTVFDDRRWKTYVLYVPAASPVDLACSHFADPGIVCPNGHCRDVRRGPTVITFLALRTAQCWLISSSAFRSVRAF